MGKGKLYAGLVHSPVINQKGEEIVTSVTNLDIHDIARLAATYQLRKYFIIQPLPKQHKLINELLSYWKDGAGAQYNQHRKKAISTIELVKSIEEVCDRIKATDGEQPKIITTGAKKLNNSVSFKTMRDKITNGGVYLLLFGTGWGLSKKVFNSADYILDPIPGLGDYNHLSVRSAASIIIDRIYGEKWW
ncbi:MAG: hypothetical protein PWQ96_372 [Clostridia bacterium]|jgi:hypothetical protein|nr:hypothetical protein [Clostridiales bacterium]MDK2984730.1 hypothetical protein [Clostridia bacterium]